MNSRELFIATVKNESPVFRRVLQAVPQDKLDYTPHPSSRTAKSLAYQIGLAPKAMLDVVSTGLLSIDPAMEQMQLNEVLDVGRNSLDSLVERLQSVDDKTWYDTKTKMAMPDGTVVWESTMGQMCWDLLHDAIHHRGQLSSYLRPMGAKVPSIYGPSGDDSGMPA